MRSRATFRVSFTAKNARRSDRLLGLGSVGVLRRFGVLGCLHCTGSKRQGRPSSDRTKTIAQVQEHAHVGGLRSGGRDNQQLLLNLDASPDARQSCRSHCRRSYRARRIKGGQRCLKIQAIAKSALILAQLNKFSIVRSLA